MPSEIPKPVRFPLLETLLAHRSLPMKGAFTSHDVANLFEVTVRTIQSRVARGQLIPRDLPGRAKFLAIDLERLLEGGPKAALEAA
jgi:phage terminase large subunit-like protein